MSDHHIELPPSFSSKQMTSWRPQQEGKLALLPVEVLLNITGEPGKDEQTLSHKDFKNLELSCGVFFRELRQAYYCTDNFAVFHSALRCVDMEAIERCYQLARPPIHLEWKVSCQCPADKPHKHHRPIDDVLECLAIGSVPTDRCIEAISWLLSKGYEANEQKDQIWYRNNRHCDHMPELLIDLLGKTSDKVRVEGICEIISMLRNHGYSLPFHMNLHKYYISWYDQKSKPGLILRSWVGMWHYVLPHWRQSTNFGNVLWGLFLDIADPLTSWKESYQGEAVDIFEKKMQLLIDYQLVELKEVKVLRRLVRVLRENPPNFDLIDEDHDGKEYWEKLCATLGLLRKMAPTRGRLHRFIIEAEWNPWTVWHDYKMQDPKHRANLSHPWMKCYGWSLIRRRNGMWYDPGWYMRAEHDRGNGVKRYKHSLPKWNLVNYDEFVAAVEGPSLKDKTSQALPSTSQDSTVPNPLLSHQ
ncbi:uncharacterized protein BKA55DRAFT_589216 [Fusarium redolens]|uniref:Uncharacterized protein n=1 Tax=Fusarium redolens TaxID=48865 RepID=A0A9P9R9R9_FUSRE|nr:uncharacterized protein BKA55DRAFT_589216 [Fusarium redolens]KAH7270864.1 hypothetical protein BKA55DRAFT_589216 [Fusarium redolens]